MHIPNLDPSSFTGTAIILGYLLTNDFTISEQAALGAWFNVVGDILASNAAWGVVLGERFVDDDEQEDAAMYEDLEVLKKAIEKLNESVEKLQKKESTAL